MTTCAISAKICFLQCVVDFVFVFFCDVEYEGPEARVSVVSV